MSKAAFLRISSSGPQRPIARRGIDDVFDPSPAAWIGLQPGDVLLRMGDEPVGSVADFQRQLYLLGVGAEVELVLLRGEETLTHRVLIESRPKTATQRSLLVEKIRLAATVGRCAGGTAFVSWGSCGPMKRTI